MRQAVLADLEGIAELLRRAHAESGLSTPYHEIRARQGLRTMLINPDQYAGVMEKDGQIVAALIGARLPSWWFQGDVAEDQFFYAMSEHRGRALPLLRDFIRWARDWGSVRQITLHVNNPFSDRAGRLYAKLGFRPVGGNYILEIEPCKQYS